jgi:ribosomal protein S1
MFILLTNYFVFYSFGHNVTGRVSCKQVSDYCVDDFEVVFPVGKVVTAKVLR